MYTYCETFTDIVLYIIIDCEKSVVKESFLRSRFGGETVEEFKYEVVLTQALNQENQ